MVLILLPDLIRNLEFLADEHLCVKQRSVLMLQIWKLMLRYGSE